MNPKMTALLQQLIWKLPSWVINVFGVIFATMVALNIITWESLRVFFDQPFHDWFGEIWNYLIGGIIAGIFINYDPRSEKVELLTDEIKEEVSNVDASVGGTDK